MKIVFQKVRSDRALVEAILEHGDEKAFRKLYRMHTPRLLGFVYRFLGRSHDEAEDVVQETWIRACKNLGRFRWESQFSTWLHGIGLNIARDLIRRKTQKSSTLTTQYAVNPKPVSQEVCMDLEDSIRQLPDGYRMVLVLHDIEGMKHQEIAERLDISVGTSKSQLFNARKTLRAMLSPDKEKQHEE